jgi:hypothetical protein
MAIERVHSFLVHPAKNETEQPEIGGTDIPRRGSLFTMLTGVFERAPEECNIDIVFRAAPGGEQQNDCRDLLVAYALHPTIVKGRLIASSLQAVSTHRSGLGLLFLMKGQVDGEQRLVISRFPADQGVIAEEKKARLSVEFVERVFMKSARAYKSAIYSSDALEGGFWDGRAVDLQITGSRELSDYWIREFLLSELRTTGPAGTKRLAVALRDAIRSENDLGVKHELISAANLMRGQAGRRQSVRQLVRQLGLSEAASAALQAAFTRADLLDEVFQFDREEFERHTPYRAVGLDNGALLIAEDARFNEVFQEQPVNQAGGQVRYITQGRVVDEELRKTK